MELFGSKCSSTCMCASGKPAMTGAGRPSERRAALVGVIQKYISIAKKKCETKEDFTCYESWRVGIHSSVRIPEENKNIMSNEKEK